MKSPITDFILSISIYPTNIKEISTRKMKGIPEILILLQLSFLKYILQFIKKALRHVEVNDH